MTRNPVFPLPYASTPQPRTVEDATNKGWKPVGINGCTSDEAVWPGTRMIPPLDIPDMVLIYDVDGNVAGMQSGAPASEFEGGVCPNSYYISNKLQGTEFCLATFYFTDPATICSKGQKKDALIFQEGATYKEADKLVTIPWTWSQALKDNWVEENYFVGMGHHFTPYEAEPENCPGIRPYQLLYGLNEKNECVITGLVWQHPSTTTERDSFEKPTSIVLPIILKNPATCKLKLGDRGMITTSHVFFGYSTQYCFSEIAANFSIAKFMQENFNLIFRLITMSLP